MLCKSVIVTGGNRGLGLEIVKQLLAHSTPPKNIIATCRSLDSAESLVNLQKQHPQNLNILKLDVSEENQYDHFVKSVSDIVGPDGLNLLINNAAVSYQNTGIDAVTWSQMVDTLTVNSVAPLMLTKALLPLLKSAASKTEGEELSVRRAAVINVSSVLGSIQENFYNGGLYPYRASKCALNAITKYLSIDLKPFNIMVTSVHPGWVRTDMGGKAAPLSPEESISYLLRTIGTFSHKENGCFIQYDGKHVPW